MAATLTVARNIAWDADRARSQRLNEAIEIVRAADRGEMVSVTGLAAARAVIDEACQPPSYDEQQHRLAMNELVDEAVRMHRLVFGWRN